MSFHPVAFLLSKGALQEGGVRAVITHRGAQLLSFRSPPQLPALISLLRGTFALGHWH